MHTMHDQQQKSRMFSFWPVYMWVPLNEKRFIILEYCDSSRFVVFDRFSVSSKLKWKPAFSDYR